MSCGVRLSWELKPSSPTNMAASTVVGSSCLAYFGLRKKPILKTQTVNSASLRWHLPAVLGGHSNQFSADPITARLALMEYANHITKLSVMQRAMVLLLHPQLIDMLFAEMLNALSLVVLQSFLAYEQTVSLAAPAITPVFTDHGKLINNSDSSLL